MHITLEYFMSCPNPNQFSVRIPRGEGVDVALAEKLTDNKTYVLSF